MRPSLGNDGYQPDYNEDQYVASFGQKRQSVNKAGSPYRGGQYAAQYTYTGRKDSQQMA